MTEAKNCCACGDAKAAHTCAICGRAVCKDCLEYLDTNAFSFMSRVPAELKLSNYCPNCFDERIGPAKLKYDELMEKANEVYFLTKAYPGYVRVIKRHTKRVEIKSCDDRRETILRLAFLAAELGFNAIIEAEVGSAKIRMGESKSKGDYQSSVWSGSAMPANIDGEQLERSSLKRL